MQDTHTQQHTTHGASKAAATPRKTPTPTPAPKKQQITLAPHNSSWRNASLLTWTLNIGWVVGAVLGLPDVSNDFLATWLGVVRRGRELDGAGCCAHTWGKRQVAQSTGVRRSKPQDKAEGCKQLALNCKLPCHAHNNRIHTQRVCACRDDYACLQHCAAAGTETWPRCCSYLVMLIAWARMSQPGIDRHGSMFSRCCGRVASSAMPHTQHMLCTMTPQPHAHTPLCTDCARGGELTCCDGVC
jgi:hypothetical protein